MIMNFQFMQYARLEPDVVTSQMSSHLRQFMLISRDYDKYKFRNFTGKKLPSGQAIFKDFVAHLQPKKCRILLIKYFVFI